MRRPRSTDRGPFPIGDAITPGASLRGPLTHLGAFESNVLEKPQELRLRQSALYRPRVPSGRLRGLERDRNPKIVADKVAAANRVLSH